MTYQNTPQDAAQNARLDALETGTLAGRTLSNPNVTGRLQLAEASTPATPSAGNYRLYPKSDGNLYVLDANGVEYRIGGAYGVGVINYITNPYANPSTDGYYLYSNTAQATPVTGSTRQVITSVDTTNDLLNLAAHGYVVGDRLRFSTSGTLPGGLALAQTYFVVATTSSTFQVSLTSGGSAVDITSAGTGTLRAYRVSGTVTGLTLSRTGTNAVAGNSMLAIAKDGSNRQGLGVSTDFVIDRYLQGADVDVSFAYQTSGGYVSGDAQPFIYDIANDALIPLNVGGLTAASTPTSAKGSFRAAAGGLVYRLVWHVASTTTAAWTLNVSQVSVGPQVSATAQGVLNYCTNPNAEASTVGWATYADAAGVAPVDGTGGTPNITWTRTTTTPLEGLASFLLTKDAANRQGQGVALDFTIAPADQGKQIVVNLVAQSSASYVASDVLLYAVDVTNSRVIQLAPSGILKADGNGGTNFTGVFQASIDSTSYRLCFHIATINAAAYTLKVDRVAIAPTQVTFAAAIEDWRSYTPSIGGLGTGSGTFNNARWRRVGDSIEIDVRFTKDGSAGTGAAAVTVSLPPGIAVDTSKTNSTNSGNRGGFSSNATVTSHNLNFFYENASATLRWTNGVGTALGADFTANSVWTGAAVLPVLGWGSNVQVGSYDGRTIVARYNQSTPTGSLSAANATKYSNKVFDSHGAYNATTGQFTAPAPGYVIVNGQSIVTGNATAGGSFVGMSIYKNSSVALNGPEEYSVITSAGVTMRARAVGTVEVAAGDTLEVRTNTNMTGPSFASNSNYNWVEFTFVPGRSVLAASDTVAFAAFKSSGSQTSSGSAQTIASWSAASYDRTGSFNPTTGEFVAPVAGIYHVDAALAFASNATGTRYVVLQKNGADTGNGAGSGNSLAGAIFSTSLSCDILLAAGDTLRLQAFQNSGGNLAYNTTAERLTYFSARRVGN